MILFIVACWNCRRLWINGNQFRIQTPELVYARVGWVRVEEKSDGESFDEDRVRSVSVGRLFRTRLRTVSQRFLTTSSGMRTTLGRLPPRYLSGSGMRILREVAGKYRTRPVAQEQMTPSWD